jgi:hypothetical protein
LKYIIQLESNEKNINYALTNFTKLYSYLSPYLYGPDNKIKLENQEDYQFIYNILKYFEKYYENNKNNKKYNDIFKYYESTFLFTQGSIMHILEKRLDCIEYFKKSCEIALKNQKIYFNLQKFRDSLFEFNIFKI